MKKITITSAVLSIFAGIGFASAQGVNGGPLINLLGLAQLLVVRFVPFMMGLAMVTFFYGLVMFMWKGKEGGEGLEKAKQFMIYSLVAIFIMVSIWGIIAIMQNVIGINPDVKPNPLYVPGQ